MGPFSIRGARVFDGERLSGPRTVTIADGLIVDGPEAADGLDAGGAVLLPGLIDAHVHLDDPAQAGVLARWGVTTALDMGSTDPSVVAGLRGARGVADVRGAGIPAGPADGTHITRMGHSAENAVSDPAEAGAWVAARVAEGSDYIKVLVEPGLPGQPAPIRPETIAAIVAAAHARGLLVIAHTTSGGSVAVAVAAGVDATTHTPLGDLLDDGLAARMAELGTVTIPTLSMMRGILDGMPVRPPHLSFDNALSSLGTLHRAGVRIVAGTDANAGAATPARPPHGESLHDELALMVLAGLSPVEVLRSATAEAAGFFGLDDRGRIEPGLRADLLLVEGDPTADISATRALRGAWVAGERVV